MIVQQSDATMRVSLGDEPPCLCAMSHLVDREPCGFSWAGPSSWRKWPSRSSGAQTSQGTTRQAHRNCLLSVVLGAKPKTILVVCQPNHHYCLWSIEVIPHFWWSWDQTVNMFEYCVGPKPPLCVGGWGPQQILQLCTDCLDTNLCIYV